MLTDEILKDLIESLSTVSLGNSAVSTDILGDAYEYLIGRFADIAKRKKAGEFYTPRSVVRWSGKRRNDGTVSVTAFGRLSGATCGVRFLSPRRRHTRHLAGGHRVARGWVIVQAIRVRAAARTPHLPLSSRCCWRVKSGWIREALVRIPSLAVGESELLLFAVALWHGIG